MTYGIVGVRHCVEGANCHRELVQDEEVSAVLKADISHQHQILIYLYWNGHNLFVQPASSRLFVTPVSTDNYVPLFA